VYDARAGRLLGQLEELKVAIPAADARFLALLPYRVEGLDLQCRLQGMKLQVTAAVRCAGRPTDHVLHLELTAPGQQVPVFAYTRNVVAPNGRLTTAVPLALNDPPGAWRVTVRDVASGAKATGTFRVP